MDYAVKSEKASSRDKIVPLFYDTLPTLQRLSHKTDPLSRGDIKSLWHERKVLDFHSDSKFFDEFNELVTTLFGHSAPPAAPADLWLKYGFFRKIWAMFSHGSQKLLYAAGILFCILLLTDFLPFQERFVVVSRSVCTIFISTLYFLRHLQPNVICA